MWQCWCDLWQWLVTMLLENNFCFTGNLESTQHQDRPFARLYSILGKNRPKYFSKLLITPLISREKGERQQWVEEAQLYYVWRCFVYESLTTVQTSIRAFLVCLSPFLILYASWTTHYSTHYSLRAFTFICTHKHSFQPIACNEKLKRAMEQHKSFISKGHRDCLS